MLNPEVLSPEPSPALSALAAADLQDHLLVAATDLERLERLLASAAESLLEHFHQASSVLGELRDAAERQADRDTRHLTRAMQHLGGAITALQFQDMSSQLINHLLQRIHSCADRLACDAMGDDDAPTIVEAPPPLPNPVTQDEMDAGSVELF